MISFFVFSRNCNPIRVPPKIAPCNVVGFVNAVLEVSGNSFTNSRTALLSCGATAPSTRSMQLHREISSSISFTKKLHRAFTYVLFVCLLGSRFISHTERPRGKAKETIAARCQSWFSTEACSITSIFVSFVIRIKHGALQPDSLNLLGSIASPLHNRLTFPTSQVHTRKVDNKREGMHNLAQQSQFGRFVFPSRRDCSISFQDNCCMFQHFAVFTVAKFCGYNVCRKTQLRQVTIEIYTSLGIGRQLPPTWLQSTQNIPRSQLIKWVKQKELGIDPCTHPHFICNFSCHPVLKTGMLIWI